MKSKRNFFSLVFCCVSSLLITGWDTEALLLAFGIAIVISIAGILAATNALRSRLVRT